MTADDELRELQIDHRLARRRVLEALASGQLSRSDVTDADPQLKDMAAEFGTLVATACPVCAAPQLRHILFGFRPGATGQAGLPLTVAGVRELQARREHREIHTVEVCERCGWNHLLLVERAGITPRPGPFQLPLPLDPGADDETGPALPDRELS